MIVTFFARLQRLWQLRWRTLSQDSRAFFARVSAPFTLLMMVIGSGTVGYKKLWLEHESSWVEGFFMTMITITTIGFGEVYPLDDSERVFTVILAVFGIGSLSYVFASSMEFLVARQLSDSRKSRKLNRMISKLSNHTIVAGYGRMGRWVVNELISQKESFVIIDIKEKHPELTDKGHLYILGDASDDAILQRAGIARARSLLAVTSSDATNAFVVMSAKALNPELYIISRNETEASISKIHRAGADAVINPYAYGGKRLVQRLLYPAVLDFMAHATEWNDELSIEEFTIPAQHPLLGKSLRELQLRERYEINVIALLRSMEDDQPSTHASPLIIPRGEESLEVGDLLIVVGSQKNVKDFAKIIAHS